MRSELTPEVIQKELNQAEAARLSKQEGRARVCARRAAGWAVVVYRRRLGEDIEDENVLHNLAWLQDEHADQRLRLAASRLMARVRTDHTLPHEEDPLVDAQLIVGNLLGAP
jgi:hypothetical protein